MSDNNRVWKAYFPGDGETADDAREVSTSVRIPKIYDAEDAARIMCAFDYTDRDGWDRSDGAFRVIIIDPDGVEHGFDCWHEPSVEHYVQARDMEESE
jgi:hypothetical protein